MNKYQAMYNERRNEGLQTKVEIVEKTVILTITDGKSNVVSVKNIKSQNSEMAYNAAFEEAVKNFFNLPDEEENQVVDPIVAEMMPSEEELMKQLAQPETTPETPVTMTEQPVAVPENINMPIEPAIPETPVTPVMSETPVVPMMPETPAAPMMPEIPEMPVEMMPAEPMQPDLPMDFVTYIPESVPMDIPMDPVIPVVEEVPQVTAAPVTETIQPTTTNPVQESFNAANPVYCDESQMGVGNPAKTLITFGCATGKTIEECSDIEILWYLNNVQSTSRFADMLQDMRTYAVSKNWIQ